GGGGGHGAIGTVGVGGKLARRAQFAFVPFIEAPRARVAGGGRNTFPPYPTGPAIRGEGQHLREGGRARAFDGGRQFDFVFTDDACHRRASLDFRARHR